MIAQEAMKEIKVKTLCYGAINVAVSTSHAEMVETKQLIQHICDKTEIKQTDVLLIREGNIVQDLTVDSKVEVYAIISCKSHTVLDNVTVKVGNIEGKSSRLYELRGINITTTIAELKRSIERIAGIASTAQRIVYCGKLCNDTYYVGDYIVGAFLKKKISLGVFHMMHSLDVTHKVDVKVSTSYAPFRDVEVPHEIGTPLTSLIGFVRSQCKVKPEEEPMFLIHTADDWEPLNPTLSLLDYGVTDKSTSVEMFLVLRNSTPSPDSPTNSPIGSPSKLRTEEGSPSKAVLNMRSFETALGSLQALKCSNQLMQIHSSGARPSKRPAGYMTRTTSRFKGLR
jgi:hypothetical protein